MTEPARTLDDICPSRRTVFQGLLALGGVALVPGVITACSSGGGESGSDDTGDEEGGGITGEISAADVAVGTAVVVELGDDKVVVAQPTEGEYVAFSAVCTHEGTDVEAGDGMQLTCPNHGSQYDAADGAAVLKGPATSPLRALDVALEGDQLDCEIPQAETDELAFQPVGEHFGAIGNVMRDEFHRSFFSTQSPSCSRPRLIRV